VFISEY